MSRVTPTHIIVSALPPLACGIGEYTVRLIDELAKRDSLDLALTTIRGADTSATPCSVDLVPRWSFWEFLRLGFRVGRGNARQTVLLQYPGMKYLRSPWVSMMMTLLRCRGKRTVVMLHEYSASTRLGRLLILMTVVSASKIVVSNQRDLDRLPSPLRRKASLVPIGSNIKIAGSDMGPSLPALSPNLLWVACLGLLVPSKRFELLIELAERRPEGIGFVVMGRVIDGEPYSYEIADRLARLADEQPGAFVFLRDAPDESVSMMLRQASVFLNCEAAPLTQKSGTTLAGCLHRLVPIAAAGESQIVNLPFANDVNALLLKDFGVDTVQATLSRLRSDSNELGRLQNGAHDLSTDFSWVSIADRFVELVTR